MRTLTYYVGMTIDGYIAGPDGSLDFFPVTPDLIDFMTGNYPEMLPAPAREQLHVDTANRRFDTGVQGRSTYQLALDVGLTSPYPHLRQLVVSRSITGSPDPAVEIVSGDPVARIRQLKAEDGKGIYLMGGGKLAGALLGEIDELVIKLYPVVIGTGVPLFSSEFSPTMFELTSCRPLDSGTVILTYTRKPAPQ